MRTLIMAGAAMLAFAAAASAENRNLAGFTGVSAADRIRVEVSIGDSYSVNVTGSDADKVRTIINDEDNLIIRRTNRPFWGGTPPIDATVRITMPRVNALASSRGAELTATNVTAQEMSLAAAMGGELRVTGTCTTLSAAVSMGGSIEAADFQCRDANIAASMGGTANLYASGSYDVAASMGGTVNVAGDGRSDDVALSMGGTLARN
jgi:hypothetical protein